MYNEYMRTDYLNPQLYNKLYSVMTYSNVLALRVALETGLRIDDVLSLKPDNLRKRTLTGIAKKTGKKFSKAISQDLSNRLKQVCGENYIFPHRTNPEKHRTRQAVWSNMKKASKLLNIDLNVAPHSARKTYAVKVFEDKGLDATQKELQHDRLSTTMIYAFSKMLSAPYQQQSFNTSDIDTLADAIADKVVEKLKRYKKTKST